MTIERARRRARAERAPRSAPPPPRARRCAAGRSRSLRNDSGVARSWPRTLPEADAAGWHSLSATSLSAARTSRTRSLSSRKREQCVRYWHCRHASAAPLYWISADGQPAAVPACGACGAARQFEFQLMPQLLNHLNLDALDASSVDWPGHARGLHVQRELRGAGGGRGRGRGGRHGLPRGVCVAADAKRKFKPGLQAGAR